jgi:hypothetical protein
MTKGKELAKKEANLPATPPVEEEWERKLKDKARAQKSAETLGVPRITHKGSVLAIEGKKVADKVIRCIVIGLVYAKQWFEHEYEQGSKDTPGCYAFGLESDKGLHPHVAAPLKQADACDGCAHNKFGTALKGKGKRCSDVRRLLVLLADDIAKDGEEETNKAIAKAQQYQISIPSGSLKGFGLYLKSLDAVTPHGSIHEAITEISTEGSESGAYTVNLRFLAEVPRKAMPALLKRGEPAFDLLSQPFPIIEQEEKQDTKPVKGQGKRR